MPVYKSGNGYKIKNVKGKSKTKKEAIKRLMAIKAKQGENSDKKDYDEYGYKKASRRPNGNRKSMMGSRMG